MELSELAGGLAHEIRNPLSTLKVNLQLLSEDLAEDTGCEMDPDLRRRALQRLETLRLEMDRLHMLLDDFLKLVTRRDFQRPDRRDLFAGLQQTGRHHVTDLIGDLPIERNAVAQVDCYVHKPLRFPGSTVGRPVRLTVQLCAYSDTVGIDVKRRVCGSTRSRAATPSVATASPVYRWRGIARH